MDKYAREAICEAITGLRDTGGMATIGNIAEYLGISLSKAHTMMGEVLGKENRGICNEYIDYENGVYLVK